MYGIIKILVILSHFVFTNGAGIKCFECYPTRENLSHGILHCPEFDWSSKFQVDCPNSTLCFKRTYTVPLGNGTEIHGVERGCAPQLFKAHRLNRTTRKWYPTETIVQGVYKEGCTTNVDNWRPGQPGEHCFCSSWFCNKSISSREISLSLIILNSVLSLLCMWQRY